MNFGQLKEIFLSYTGITDDIDNAELAIWFNEAQLDLSWDLAPVQTYYLEAKAGQKFFPPDDWLILLGGDHLFDISPEGGIIPAQDGTLTLYYRSIPQSLTGVSEDETSGLHNALHYLLPLFAASRYWDKEAEGDGEETNQSNRWLSYYYQGKNLAKAKLFGVHQPIDKWEIRG